MKLHQLRYLREIARQGLSFSKAAAALHTSQPGISKQIQRLEQELGVALFIRSGNRIVELTPPGQRIVEIASTVLRETESLKSVAKEFLESDTGTLTVGATFTLARYLLPKVLKRFAERYPQVHLKFLQGSSDELCRLVAAGDADIALTTKPAAAFPTLFVVEYGDLPRALIAPKGHALARTKRISLETLSCMPLITLAAGSYGQARMRELFAVRRLEPNIVFSVANVDVVKAFVEAGLGVAVVSKMAFDPKRDRGLQAVRVDHLFEPHRSCLAVRRNQYLRGFAFDFIQMVAPDVNRSSIEQAVITGPL